jgi:Flp pilus assembly protein TadG
METGMRGTLRRAHREQSGMVGMIIVVWLLFVAVLGIFAIDAASVLFTKFRLSDAAATAASTAVSTYQNERDVTAACGAAQLSVHQADADATMGKGWCKVDTTSGDVTITLRKTATSIIAGRFSFTRDLTKVVQRETASPSSL